MFRSTVEALAIDERSKKHSIMADRLIQGMNSGFHEYSRELNGYGKGMNLAESGKSRDLYFELSPQKRFEDLMLPDSVLRVTDDLAQEHFRRDLLRSYALEPRHKVLLAGPPGNGKTSYAEALAEKLMVPLLVVRYENLITSYLGETSSKLLELFQYARQTKCVLFFDEFDAIGKERGDSHETGEIKRVVSTLLLQIDRLPSHVVVVTASNHPELLDRAVWRRFDLRIELPNPTLAQRVKYVQSFFEKRSLNSPKGVSSIAQKLGNISFAEVELFCVSILRKSVLSNGKDSVDSIIPRMIAEWGERYSLTK